MSKNKYCKFHRKQNSWWYRLWDEQKTLVFGIGIIGIALTIWGITSSLTKEDLAEISNKNLSISKPGFDTLKTLQKDLIIKLDSLLKQPNDSLEYEKNKDALSRLSNEYVKGLVKDETKKILDSVLSSNRTIVKEISQKPHLWSGLFPDGYGLFYLGVDKKVTIAWNISNPAIIIRDSAAIIKEINKNTMELLLPKINLGSMTWVNSSLSVDRNLSSLNKITYTTPIYNVSQKNLSINTGIISDNENGIVGFIGFGDLEKSLPNQRILDYNKLKFAYK